MPEPGSFEIISIVNADDDWRSYQINKTVFKLNGFLKVFAIFILENRIFVKWTYR